MKARDWPLPLPPDRRDRHRAGPFLCRRQGTARRSGFAGRPRAQPDPRLQQAPRGLCRTPDEGCVLGERLEKSIASALQGGAPSNGTYYEIDWPAVVAELASLPLRDRPAPSATISVCILHHDRLRLLAEAIASIPDKIGDVVPEIVVIDNASPIAGIEDKIREVAKGRGGIAGLDACCNRCRRPLPTIAASRQRAATSSPSWTTTTCFSRMDWPASRAALANGCHDIVVSALDMFDEDWGWRCRHRTHDLSRIGAFGRPLLQRLRRHVHGGSP